MHDDIRQTADKNVWGVLTWIEPMPFGGFSCMLVSGATVPSGSDLDRHQSVVHLLGRQTRHPPGGHAF